MARPANMQTLAASDALGDWVRSARASQGISQRALADRAGLSRSYLCDIERGRGAQPSVTTLDKLATALGASRADLLRVAGILESVAKPGDERERRLLAIVRDLDIQDQDAVERFARFLHAEQHRWVQPRLLEGANGDDESTGPTISVLAGPTLFDGLEVAGGVTRE